MTNATSAITQTMGTTQETSTMSLEASFAELIATTQALTAAQQQQLAQSTASSTVSSGSSFFSWLGFAKGGVMSSSGSLRLKKYASGGVADSPHLALFGEGSKPEAFVPLPDGRSIPVTLQGGSDMGGNYSPVTISIQVNNNGDSSTESQSSNGNGKGWSEIADKIKGMVVQEIATQKRPGGVLYLK